MGNAYVLDFFSGSATTAHAVMQLNAEDGGNRKFIMVQLPEVCAEDSEAAKAGMIFHAEAQSEVRGVSGEARFKKLSASPREDNLCDSVSLREVDSQGGMLGEYARMFEDEYTRHFNERLSELPFDSALRKYWEGITASKTHAGYFAEDKKHRLVDSNDGKESESDTSAYDLILKNKEQLLSFGEPVRFIFSHSALREGWDTAGNDYSEDFTAEIVDGRILLKNAHPSGFALFFR